MPWTSRASIPVRLCLVVYGILFADWAGADPVIWTGPDITFSKAALADQTQAANQDHITDDVWITRGSNQGIFNASSTSSDCDLSGCFFNHGASPADTEWATTLNNPGATINVSNPAVTSLSYTDWEDAYGAAGSLQGNITALPAVVHLLTEDIYLNLKFTAWGAGGSGGAFTYERSTAAAALTPTGDYNGNGVVDAADYTVWRDTLGQMVPKGTGADGNADGTINSQDYDFWKMNFGNPAPGAGGGAGAATTVPEPATALLLLLGVLALVAHRTGTLLQEGGKKPGGKSAPCARISP